MIVREFTLFSLTLYSKTMVNAIKTTITRWICSKCKTIYKYKGVADYCCSEEETKKYG